MLPATTQFRSTTTQSGKKAFEAWCAVLTHNSEEIAICAPTLEGLRGAWQLVTQQVKLDESRVQHVWIVAFEKLDDAPETKNARGAAVACHFCGRQASFIIRKIATCERRECKEKADGV
jgi:hypothetical protein